MNILIFSDIHGDLRALEKIVKQQADVYIAAGRFVELRQGPRPLRRNPEAAGQKGLGAAGKS